MPAPEQVSTASTVPFSVVVGSDFSPLGDRAVLEALRFCSAHATAALHVITVAAESPTGLILPGATPRSIPSKKASEVAWQHAAGIVDDYLAQGQSLPMERVAVYVAVGTPSERILALATAVDADLVVLGTHSREGLSRILLGSVAEEVVRRAPCGVFVIRPRDFLRGEKLPEIQPPLKPGEHPLMPFRVAPTFHQVHRLSREPGRLMPAI